MDDALIMNFRFSVSFLRWGILNSTVDTRFQNVSGLSADVSTTTVEEGGQNLYTHKLPQRVGYGNLTLTRGKVIRSTLNFRFDDALARFAFQPTEVLVMLLDDKRDPLWAWLFHGAYPVKWSTADLNASEPAVLIDTLELSYTRMQPLHI